MTIPNNANGTTLGDWRWRTRKVAYDLEMTGTL